MNQPLFPPPPTPTPEKKTGLNPLRDNPYLVLGIILILANFLPGILLYALIASIIGEQHLEGPDARLGWLGALLVWAGPILGTILVLFGRPIGRVIGPLSPVFPTVGLLLGVAGLAIGRNGLNQTSTDPNIGAALLVLGSPLLILVSLIWLVTIFIKKYRDRARGAIRPSPDIQR